MKRDDPMCWPLESAATPPSGCERMHAILKKRLLWEIDPFFPNAYGNTAVHLAAYRGDCQRLNTLFHTFPEQARKAMVQTNQQGDTPLHLAARAAQSQIVRFFLDQELSADLRNQKGQTPLCCLLRGVVDETLSSEQAKTATLLLRAGALWDEEPNQPSVLCAITPKIRDQLAACLQATDGIAPSAKRL